MSAKPKSSPATSPHQNREMREKANPSSIIGKIQITKSKEIWERKRVLDERERERERVRWEVRFGESENWERTVRLGKRKEERESDFVVNDRC